MVKAPQTETGPGKPIIFLVLAAVMVAGAVLAYVYEDWLYLHRPYREILPTDANIYFIMVVLIALFGAFFFLLCYLKPSLGNRILGRGPIEVKDTRSAEGTITYNIFADTTPSSVKMMHRHRKTARAERHKYAKITREEAAKKAAEKKKP